MLAPNTNHPARNRVTKGPMDGQDVADLVAGAVQSVEPSIAPATAQAIANGVLGALVGAGLGVVDATGQTIVRDDSTHEKRRQQRDRVLRHARIIYSASSCTMDCIVMDLSENGARIKPSDMLLCPEEFTLRVPFGTSRDCEVVWRRNTEVGVRFM